jgi:hypothetical protein
MELKDIAIADMKGLKDIPSLYSTPAAIGISIKL